MATSTDTRARLAECGWVDIHVDGDCMAPTLRRGDHVLVRHVSRKNGIQPGNNSPASRPRVGDVTLLDANGWLEIHRIVGRIDMGPRSWYVHMGDASPECGLANDGDMMGIVSVERPRRGPTARAHALTLAYRLGALLIHLVPGLRGSRRMV